MKKILLIVSVAVLFFTWAGVSAQTVDPYKAALVDYLTVSGTLVSLDITFDQLLTMMGTGLTTQQKDEVKKKSTERLIELMTPLYKNHIALDDLKAINAFFGTPAGKRISAAQPLIVKETTQVSMQWAGELQTLIQNGGK